MALKNKRLQDDEFFKMRQEVLNLWPTGKDVDLDEAIEYQKRNLAQKNVTLELKKAKASNKILTQPRAGIAPVDPHIELIQYIEKYGKADILPASVDSYSRANRFADAQKAIERSEREGHSFLNGLPIVNYGVKECRRVTEAVSVPSELRTASVDVRLVSEIAFAAGYTAFVHGPVCPTMHYSKYTSLEDAIKNYFYVHRLMGIYTERSIPIMAEFFGIFSNVGVPQSLVYTAQVAEMLIAAEQGVKFIGISTVLQGNLNQDIAGLRILPKLMRKYLDMFGYHDVDVALVAHQWTGPFPENESEAYALDALNTIAAVQGKANMIMVKSIEQGVALPSKEANAAAMLSTKYMINLLKDQEDIVTPEITLEMAMIEKETTQIMEKVLEMGEGDIVSGIINAFESGMLESPFSSNRRYVRNKIMVCRDAHGACRYLDFGDLPFSQDVKEYNTGNIQKRAEKENREAETRMITDSILGMSMGELVYNSERQE